MPHRYSMLAVAGSLLLLGGAASATTIHVPAVEPTIQAGIDAAAPGDTVEVACGTYFEHYVEMKSGVVLRSATGDPACVTIDAQRLDRVLHCQGMNSETKVEGFTLVNGLSSESGCLWCVFSTMTIENCVIQDNEGVYDSPGIGLYQASPTIRGCVFRNNRTGDTPSHNRGGGIYIQDQCFPTIEDCTFEGNEARLGGAIWCNIAEPTIRNCTFVGNTGTEGGGVSIENSPFVLEGCVFYGNTAEEGGGLRLNNATGAVRNCTFYANSAPGGGQVFITGSAAVPSIEYTIVAFGAGCNAVVCMSGGSVSASCSVVYGNVGGDWNWCLAGMQGVNGNFWADPDFCDGPGGDVSIRSSSPCAPPGATGCGLVGALGVGCGPVRVEPFSWGQVKSLYRGE